MLKSIKFQLKSAFYSRNFLLTVLIGVIYAMICFAIKCAECFGSDIVNVPSAYQQFFFNARSNDMLVFIFAAVAPFLSCAAFSDSFVADCQNNFIQCCIIRTGKIKYYFSKLISVFICGALAVMIPQILNYLLCVITFPADSSYMYTWDLWQADIYTVDISGDWFLFKGLYIFSPYLYFSLFIVISGIISGATAVIGFQISFFIKNRIFAASFMFAAVNLLGVYLNTYNIPYNISDCMFGLSVSGITQMSFFITCGIYILISVLFIPLSIRRLNNCV